MHYAIATQHIIAIEKGISPFPSKSELVTCLLHNVVKYLESQNISLKIVKPISNTVECNMPHRRVNTPIEQLQPFERGRIVGLREAGWAYQWITAHVGHNVLVVCRSFQKWSVEHSHAHRPSSG